MKTQSFNEIENLTKEYSMIPICKEIYADVITPIQLLRKMEAFDKNFFLLESVEGGEKWARYSFFRIRAGSSYNMQEWKGYSEKRRN